jgi:hypothetical protein
VRKTLFGHSEATYSGYTCYTGIADFVPPDIDTVGYVSWILELLMLFSKIVNFHWVITTLSSLFLC